MKNLFVEIPVNIRFSDTDAMGVVWHGNYLRFFEDAREAFGQKYKLHYLDIYKHGFFTPIVKSSIEHKSPLYYGEKAKVLARYIPSSAAKMVFEYELTNLSSGLISAVGSTVQIFMDAKERTLELSKPDFFYEWEKVHKIVS